MLFHGVAFGHEFFIVADNEEEALAKLMASPSVVIYTQDAVEDGIPQDEIAQEVLVSCSLRQDSPNVFCAPR